ncbi:MAG: site-2 protease family protein [Halobacteriaceae archaeon]
MRSYTVGRIWDIPIRINVSLVVFLPILAWLIGSGGQIPTYAGWIEGLTGVAFDLDALTAGSTPWVVGTVAAVGLFVSVTLHELGHSWVALRYGIGIESITLWILGGIAAFTELPREWDRELWIAVAGPITSVLVAGGSYAALLAMPGGPPTLRFVLGWLAITNLVLAAFNMLPAFPMDGGRVLRAVLARSRPYASATRTAARIGVGFSILFAVVGVLTVQLLFLLLAWFVYTAATSESRTVLIDELLAGLTVGDVMTRDPATVDADASVAALGESMLRDRQTVYPVVDGERLVGVVALGDLQRVRQQDRQTTAVGDLARDVPRVGTDDAFDTLATLSQAGATNALVLEGGVLVGVLSESDYAAALTFRQGFESALPA